MSRVRAFVNARLCCAGEEVAKTLYVNLDTGLFVAKPAETISSADSHDLKGCFLAPAFIELQTNGSLGIHFTNFVDTLSYNENLAKVSQHLLTTGVGAFYVTLPTVNSETFQKVLPLLKPRAFPGGAYLLGAHCEGPWLNPAKKGAHNAQLMQSPDETAIEEIYGNSGQLDSVKLVTLAPELKGSMDLISTFASHNIRVSLGHSAADFDTGLKAMTAGARALTHVFNAMSPLHHRTPGLAGLIASSESPYFSLIADGIHLHPATLSLAFRSDPGKCILITDSIEMAGLPDGVYPGNAQIPHLQRKLGNKVTIDGTDTLIGSCCSLEECVRNLKQWNRCSLPEAVRCATENVANFMGITDRGMIQEGRLADFNVLDEEGRILQTWIKGEKIYER